MAGYLTPEMITGSGYTERGGGYTVVDRCSVPVPGYVDLDVGYKHYHSSSMDNGSSV